MYWAVYSLLPRGSHASETREGNARQQNSHHSLGSRPFSCATGRAAPPVRSGRLIRTNVGSRKRPGSLILYILQVHRAGVPPGENLGARGMKG
jgi:hypothetical protein